MKISYNWLKDYVGFNLEVNEVSNILTSVGLEVEGLYDRFASFDHLVIGKVIECEQHPNADKLKLTKVDIGTGIKTIVCGAPNIVNDVFVVVVNVGESLIDEKGKVFKINKTKIRGEYSEGMICSEEEIGLGSNNDGVIIIEDKSIKIGSLARDYFNIQKDFCFEIGLTPNRTDALGHIGVAKDLYAYLMTHIGKGHDKFIFSKPSVHLFKPIESDFKVNVDILRPDLCPLYIGVCINNITISESPNWLKNRLISIGLKPINNIVDVTNYVLHETGNPLHAFDYNKISSNKLFVDTAKKNEYFTTIDGNKIKLHPEDLVIYDSEKIVCLAGVMGGLNSAVSTDTKSIFLECAYFAPSSIRRTSKRHGVMSDSSYRFERGVDFNNCIYAIKRATLLIQQICKDARCSNQIICDAELLNSKEVSFSFKACNKILGHNIDKNTVLNILNYLDFEILSSTNDTCILKVPTYRVDVSREIDVIEEILRIYGYNNIELSNRISFKPSFKKDTKYDFKQNLSKFLSYNGFYEIKNNSLTKKDCYKHQSIESQQVVQIINPLSQDLSIMRTNLLYGALETIKYNLNRQQTKIKLYEFGKTYMFNNNNYIEEEKLGVFIAGEFKGNHWDDKVRDVDFFLAKGILDKILFKFFDCHVFKTSKTHSDLFSFSLAYYLNDKIIAEIGLVSNQMLALTGVKRPVYFIDINFKFLSDIYSNNSLKYVTVPKFPQIKRDLSLLIDHDIVYMDIHDFIKKNSTNLLVDVLLFDVYEGEELGKGKKSYAISFIFQDPKATLTDQKIDNEMVSIYKKLQNKFSLCLRDGELS